MNLNTSLAAPGTLSHRLQRLQMGFNIGQYGALYWIQNWVQYCKIQNGLQGPQNGRRGLKKVSNARLLGAPINFRQK